MNKKTIKEYRIWKAMKARCSAPSFKESNYQKNKIKVCDRWINSYENFIADMGRIPNDDYSIERINNCGDYTPTNCKWIHKSEQPKNRGSFNRIFYHDGKYKNLKDWAKHFGIKYTTLYSRIFRNGIRFEDAIKDDPSGLKFEIDGKKMRVYEWCKLLGVKPMTVYDRMHKGWSFDRAIKTPIIKKVANKI